MDYQYYKFNVSQSTLSISIYTIISELNTPMCKIVGYEKLFLCLMLIEMTFEVRRYSNGLRAYVFSDPN